MPTFRFIEDPATRQISCFIQPAPTSELNAFRLRQAWESSGFESCLIFPERIEPALLDAMNALAAATRDNATVSVQDGDSAPPLATFVIAERRDSHCSIAVSDDCMNVEATLLTAQGGKPLDRAMVLATLEAAGVRFGAEEHLLDQMLEDAAGAAPGSTLRRTIAHGKRPAKGIPSRFENLVVPFQDRVLKPQERNDGSIDFLDLGRIETVSAGCALVRRHPASAGESGMSVYGKEIPSEVPAETDFTVGDGTEVDGTDSNLLRATRTGVPHRTPNGMSVNDVLDVAAVDLHTGHVEFDGSLVVKGDVHPDMKVRVTKDLVVAGFIESADVEAGGDIIANKGIIGPAALGALHTCRVKGRNIRTHYVQHAVLEAEDEITLDTHLVNSVVRHCRRLIVGGEHPRNSRIVGGEIHASESIGTAIVGAENGTPTRLVFDDGIQRLRREGDSRHAHRVNIQKTGAALEGSLKDLAQKPRTEALNEMMTRIANTIRAYRQELAQLDAEDEERRRQVAALVAGCRVTATVRIHGGVELVCLDARHRFGSDRGPGTLGVREGNWVGLDE